MIEIQIKTDGKQVMDKFYHEECSIGEVGLVLLRLKQIEQVLIDKQFDSDMEMSEFIDGNEDE